MFGMIGGLGPKATARFYSALMDGVAHRAIGSLPRFVMYNVAMSPRIENAFLAGEVGRQSPERAEVRSRLSEAVAFFCRNGVDVVAMPCNTLQEELATICSEKRINHIDMIDETAKSAVARGVRRVFIMGTASTCRSDIYGRRLRDHRIACVYPEGAAQRGIENTIRNALDGRSGPYREAVIDLVRTSARECDGIVIACSDLTECFSEPEVGKPVFDSLMCLANTSADWILGTPKRHLIENSTTLTRLGDEFRAESNSS